MGLLSDQLVADALAMTSTDEFGQDVSYTPSGGSARTIPAVVNYNPPSTMPESGKVLTGDASVEIRNHATLGATTITTQRDTITMPARIGGASRSWTIVEIISQDAGMFLVRVR